MANLSLLVDGAIMEKLKQTVTNVFKVDEETKLRTRLRFQHALYDKLFGKALAFEYVKTTILGQWQDFRRIFISDMAKGFMLIWCENDEVKQKIVFGGPWNVKGMTLQFHSGNHSLSPQ